MQVQTVLYYRYLLRQTIIVLAFSLIISLIISLLLFLLRTDLVFHIVGGLVWILPLGFIIQALVYGVKYKIYFKQLQNKELFKRITNKAVRTNILKSSIQIKIFFPKKNQHQEFFKAIKLEIEKQKKVLNILNRKHEKEK